MYSQARPGRHAFQERTDRNKPSKTDINLIVMDYLISEGYPLAAKRFANEANINQVNGDTEHIQERVEIRNAILEGDIQTAIEKINDLNPDLLEFDESLHFALLRLQLIELIRKYVATPDLDITPALEFAQTHLAPRAPTNPEFLSDLEKTMALLIFPADKLTAPLAGLLDLDMRPEIAARVNGALLRSFGDKDETKLKRLLRLRAWAERKTREAGKDLPPNFDLWDDEDARNEREDTVMTDNGEQAHAEADTMAL